LTLTPNPKPEPQVRKEFSDGSYRARNIWMKLQLQDQIGLLEQGVMPTMKGEALMKVSENRV